MHHLVQIRSGVPLLPASKPSEGISKIQHSSRRSRGVEFFLLSILPHAKEIETDSKKAGVVTLFFVSVFLKSHHLPKDGGR